MSLIEFVDEGAPVEAKADGGGKSGKAKSKKATAAAPKEAAAFLARTIGLLGDH